MSGVTPNILLNIEGLPKYFTMIHQRSLDIAIVTFAELGIADRLLNASPSQGLTAEEISAEEKWNVDLVHRLLRACADAGIVENVNIHLDDRHFVLTPSGRLLSNNHPLHARQFLQCQQKWLDHVRSRLTQVVRDGDTNKEKNNESACLNAYLAFGKTDMRETLKEFMLAMDALACESSDLLISSPLSVNFTRFQSIVDCGGCNGAFLARLLARYPNIKRGIVFDLPHTIEEASNQHFEESGIDSCRYEFIKGNLVDSASIPSDVDAYILKYVLDCYEDRSVIDILSAIGQAAQRNSEKRQVFLLIIEDILLSMEETEKGGNWMSSALDVMLGGTADGKERTVHQYKLLFAESGWEFVHLYPVRAPSSIIEARLLRSSSGRKID